MGKSTLWELFHHLLRGGNEENRPVGSGEPLRWDSALTTRVFIDSGRQPSQLSRPTISHVLTGGRETSIACENRGQGKQKKVFILPGNRSGRAARHSPPTDFELVAHSRRSIADRKLRRPFNRARGHPHPTTDPPACAIAHFSYLAETTRPSCHRGLARSAIGRIGYRPI